MEKHIHGGDVYHHQGCIDFSANCNPLGTPEGIKKAIIESLDHIGDYPQVGCAPLKEAIAEYEHTKPEQVICGNGAARGDLFPLPGGKSKESPGAGSHLCRVSAGAVQRGL